MRFLHTSDWHLGKRLEGQSRLNEQKDILNEICDICEREKIEIVLIAGDIFDCYNPSAEAESLFYDTLYKLTKNHDRVVVAISGNHDDAERLTASKSICDKLGVYLVGNIDEHNFQQSLCSIKLIESGNGYLVFENSLKEKVYIDLLPYPNEARFKESVDENEDFNDKVNRWIEKTRKNNVENLPEILVGHFFTLGGEISESERGIDLGGTRVVDNSVLPDINYIALGHLHKKQVVSHKKNAYYSGSIACYAFDEAGKIIKSVNCFDIENNKTTNFREIPITTNIPLARLSASSIESAYDLLENYKNSYVELTLFLTKPLTSNESKNLKNTFPNILNLKLVFTGETQKIESKKSLSDSEIFDEYYKSKYNDKPGKELKELALKLLMEVENETH